MKIVYIFCFLFCCKKNQGSGTSSGSTTSSSENAGRNNNSLDDNFKNNIYKNKRGSNGLATKHRSGDGFSFFNYNGEIEKFEGGLKVSGKNPFPYDIKAFWNNEDMPNEEFVSDQIKLVCSNIMFSVYNLFNKKSEKPFNISDIKFTKYGGKIDPKLKVTLGDIEIDFKDGYPFLTDDTGYVYLTVNNNEGVDIKDARIDLVTMYGRTQAGKSTFFNLMNLYSEYKDKLDSKELFLDIEKLGDGSVRYSIKEKKGNSVIKSHTVGNGMQSETIAPSSNLIEISKDRFVLFTDQPGMNDTIQPDLIKTGIGFNNNSAKGCGKSSSLIVTSDISWREMDLKNKVESLFSKMIYNIKNILEVEKNLKNLKKEKGAFEKSDSYTKLTKNNSPFFNNLKSNDDDFFDLLRLCVLSEGNGSSLRLLDYPNKGHHFYFLPHSVMSNVFSVFGDNYKNMEAGSKDTLKKECITYYKAFLEYRKNNKHKENGDNLDNKEIFSQFFAKSLEMIIKQEMNLANIDSIILNSFSSDLLIKDIEKLYSSFCEIKEIKNLLTKENKFLDEKSLCKNLYTPGKEFPFSCALHFMGNMNGNNQEKTSENLLNTSKYFYEKFFTNLSDFLYYNCRVTHQNFKSYINGLSAEYDIYASRLIKLINKSDFFKILNKKGKEEIKNFQEKLKAMIKEKKYNDIYQTLLPICEIPDLFQLCLDAGSPEVKKTFDKILKIIVGNLTNQTNFLLELKNKNEECESAEQVIELLKNNKKNMHLDLIFEEKIIKLKESEVNKICKDLLEDSENMDIILAIMNAYTRNSFDAIFENEKLKKNLSLESVVYIIHKLNSGKKIIDSAKFIKNFENELLKTYLLTGLSLNGENYEEHKEIKEIIMELKSNFTFAYNNAMLLGGFDDAKKIIEIFERVKDIFTKENILDKKNELKELLKEFFKIKNKQKNDNSDEINKEIEGLKDKKKGVTYYNIKVALEEILSAEEMLSTAKKVFCIEKTDAEIYSDIFFHIHNYVQYDKANKEKFIKHVEEKKFDKEERNSFKELLLNYLNEEDYHKQSEIIKSIKVIKDLEFFKETIPLDFNIFSENITLSEFLVKKLPGEYIKVDELQKYKEKIEAVEIVKNTNEENIKNATLTYLKNLIEQKNINDKIEMLKQQLNKSSKVLKPEDLPKEQKSEYEKNIPMLSNDYDNWLKAKN